MNRNEFRETIKEASRIMHRRGQLPSGSKYKINNWGCEQRLSIRPTKQLKLELYTIDGGPLKIKAILRGRKPTSFLRLFNTTTYIQIYYWLELPPNIQEFISQVLSHIKSKTQATKDAKTTYENNMKAYADAELAKHMKSINEEGAKALTNGGHLSLHKTADTGALTLCPTCGCPPPTPTKDSNAHLNSQL